MSEPMNLPFDILYYILSFLKSHPRALLACSKAHPVLSQIVERYRFHHIIIRVDTEGTDIFCSFKPSDLRRHLIETPQIVRYVAVLQIELQFYWCADRIPYLEEIASLLPMFPVLECIMLPTRFSWVFSWKQFPQSFKTAVANCLHLPTLQEIHIGDISFPLSLLDNHANVNHLSLSGLPEIGPGNLEITYPQIKYLTLEGLYRDHSDFLSTWFRQHIVGLQSLSYDFSSEKMTSEVLKICSDTLENLYLYLEYGTTQRKYLSYHLVWPCTEFLETEEVDLINISSLPRLRHLTLRVDIFLDHPLLLPAVGVLKTASSLQQLTINFCVDYSVFNLNEIDLSPLGVLTDPSLRFSSLNLYMYSSSSDLCVTHAMMVSVLARHDGLLDLIERGRLIVHPGEAAPTLSRSYTAVE